MRNPMDASISRTSLQGRAMQSATGLVESTKRSLGVIQMVEFGCQQMTPAN